MPQLRAGQSQRYPQTKGQVRLKEKKMVEEDLGGGPEGMNEAVVSDKIICHSKWMMSEQPNTLSGWTGVKGQGLR